MATKTNSDIRTQVLRKLFVAEGAEVPEADDDAVVKDVMDSCVEYLRDEGVAWWADDAVPLQCADALAEYIAGFAAPTFAPERMEAYAQMSQRGERRLRRLSAKAAEGAPIRAVFY